MSQLIKYENACRALAECKAVDEVKAWSDKAAAMQAYGRIAKDKTLEVDAAEIRLRAERRLGELLIEQKSRDGLNTGSRSQLSGKSAEGLAVVTNDRQTIPTLADAGISKDLSSRAQKLAAVPEDEFEREVGDWRERVSEEGARVTARLEAAGDKAQKAPREKSPEPEPSQESPELIDLREKLAEMISICESQREDIDSMARVFDADDKIGAALAEAKRYREQLRIVESRVTGLQNECQEAKRYAKSLQRKLEKLERGNVAL